MQRYKTIFSSFHTIYRLSTSLVDLRSFLVGISRLYRHLFKADKVILICKNIDNQGFIKVYLEDKRQCIKRGGISILNHTEREILSQNREIIFNNRLIYPFIFTEVLGAIYLKRKSKFKDFNEIEKKWFLALSEEVSISLKNFLLYREQQKIMFNYVKLMTKFLNQHIPTSYLHQKLVSRLINTMGKAMKLPKNEILTLERAALLHDAGKIQVPSKLLKKEKPLTEEEFKLISKHPRKGVELFKNLQLLRPAIPIILHHHERYDGRGYPAKLKKEKIPLGSRILSVLDTFDAMYFGRPYKKRRSLKDIENEFKKQKGKQFDPKIVDIFLRILKRKSIHKYLKNTLRI
ncbi:MAG: HD domain-containing protein [Candidatus Omnitrophica bacterium]|jgi:HD-GYP domain-containing protein (c-di-GMP phosphodiesterase class II)|nr:HD domain-containing protein [Candidatus Omnitrophota bacterium]